MPEYLCMSASPQTLSVLKAVDVRSEVSVVWVLYLASDGRHHQSSERTLKPCSTCPERACRHTLHTSTWEHTRHTSTQAHALHTCPQAHTLHKCTQVRTLHVCTLVLIACVHVGTRISYMNADTHACIHVHTHPYTHTLFLELSSRLRI